MIIHHYPFILFLLKTSQTLHQVFTQGPSDLAMEAENAFGFLELLNVTLAAVWSTTHIANLDGRRLCGHIPTNLSP